MESITNGIPCQRSQQIKVRGKTGKLGKEISSAEQNIIQRMLELPCLVMKVAYHQETRMSSIDYDVNAIL